MFYHKLSCHVVLTSQVLCSLLTTQEKARLLMIVNACSPHRVAKCDHATQPCYSPVAELSQDGRLLKYFDSIFIRATLWYFDCYFHRSAFSRHFPKTFIHLAKFTFPKFALKTD